MTIIAHSANDAYIQLAKEFQYGSSEETNGRQQGGIHELRNITIELHDPRKCVVSVPFRNLSRKYAAGEFALFMAQNTKTTDYAFYAKKWLELDVDGTVCSAYGERIFNPNRDKLGVSRFDYALSQLLENPESKNAVIMMRDASDNRPLYQKDKCCTLHIQFMIRNNKLDMTVAMRSSDYWFGLPYDIFWYSAVMQRMLFRYNNQTGKTVTLGVYRHECASLHIYEKQWPKVVSAIIPTYKGAERELFEEYVYDPSKDYQYPIWDAFTESELSKFLVWEISYRTSAASIESKASLLRVSKFHPFLETMGSFLVNKIKSRYPTEQDEKYLALATEESTHSTCKDRKVGCLILGTSKTVVLAHNHVVACNGLCDDKEHRICEVVHAEIGALKKSREAGLIPEKAYVTLYPCLPCMTALTEAGVKEVIVQGFSHKGATGSVTLLDPAFSSGV